MESITGSAVAIPRLPRVGIPEREVSSPARRDRAQGSRLFAELIWVAFVAAQAADGVFTYVGIRLYGVEIEANPIIAWYAAAFGPGVALLGAKGVAIAAALILYRYGRHRTLGVLTIWYLLVAIWPWTLVLWP